MKPPTERLLLLPRCASSSDTVREIKYQILHSYDATRLSDNVRFERFIREVAKAGPQHRTAKAKSKRTKSPKAKKKAPPKRG
jgi:hypothetical protein